MRRIGNIVRTGLDLLHETIIGWLASNAALHAAALAFYTVLSLAPLLIITVSIVAQAYETEEVEWQIVTGVEKQAGTEAASLVRDIIVTNRSATTRNVAAGVSILFLLFGASAVFHQLQQSLNAMWDLIPRARTVRQSLIAVTIRRGIATVLALTVGYLLLGALLVNTFLSSFTQGFLENILIFSRYLAPLVHMWTSLLLYTVLFAAVFKLLPQARIRWRDVWPGAALTAFLFWLGGYLIGLYLAHSLVKSLYGAAGSVMVFLLWVYYSTWFFLFGAKFTQVYADRCGASIAPAANMTRV